MNDQLRVPRNCVRWSRVDPNKDGGIHDPKLAGDTGFDLVAMETRTIGPMEACDVPVNCRIWLPQNWYADVRNRSSMARRGLYVDQNLIDNGYRGPMFVFIRNMLMPTVVQSMLDMSMKALRITEDPHTVTVHEGDRIAQLVFHKGQPAWSQEIPEVPMDTDRAADGFGSTGK